MSTLLVWNERAGLLFKSTLQACDVVKEMGEKRQGIEDSKVNAKERKERSRLDGLENLHKI